MELLKLLNEEASLLEAIETDRQIFVEHGFNPDEVITLAYLTEVERAAVARAGETSWARELAGAPTETSAKKAPADEIKMRQERGSKTEPQRGDLVLLPNGKVARIEKHFMKKVTIARGGKKAQVSADRLVASKKSGPNGEVIWAVKR